MKYKKIAVISYHTCPLSDEDVTEAGGLNTYVLELCKALAKKGYVLDIYTRSVSSESPRVVGVTPGLRVIHTIAGDQRGVGKRELIKYIPQFLKNIYEFMAEEKLEYDLVYCHYYLSGLAGLEIKKKFKIPLLINFHTLALMKNLVARDESEREDFARIKAEMKLLKKADKVIATSSTDATYISSLYMFPLKKIFVLTPGVNLEIFKPADVADAKRMIGTDPKSRVILFVGRIEPLKGIDVLLYSLKILVEHSPKLKLCLVIVGGENIARRDKWSKELKRLFGIAKLLKIAPFVRFVGKKKQQDLPSYYNASEVVVMPSQYESFGIVALEAMACGVPVITTDVSGISHLFDDSRSSHSLITSAGNPILLSRKIKNLLINKKEYEKLSAEVLNKAKALSWDGVADRFVGVLGS